MVLVTKQFFLLATCILEETISPLFLFHHVWIVGYLLKHKNNEFFVLAPYVLPLSNFFPINTFRYCPIFTPGQSEEIGLQVKTVVSYLLVLVASMGWGITKPFLESSAANCAGVCARVSEKS